MKCWLLPVALLISTPLLRGDDRPATADKITGSWRVVGTEFDGQALAAEVIKDRELVFQDGTFKVVIGGSTRRTLQFKLDAKKTPGHIDITNPDKKESSLGIYTIEKDEFRLCYGEPGDARPTEFSSPTGKRIYLIRLKRAAQP